MPPKRSHKYNPSKASKASNSYSQKRKILSTTYSQSTKCHTFSDKIWASFLVEVDETGNRFSSTEISFNNLLARDKTKEHKTYFGVEHSYVARIFEETQ
ncbi:1442_t:CDS:2 [Racocetra persica]|uniref:1442_t:CDS:1 n=1 Tax=Racocetra persica TaxID=160502 RepID=A0ACA9PKM2_9GLOM|nr:1442_t:CDS:2 [Racocetra persica]